MPLLDSKTLGPARLGFADEKDLDEFVAQLGSFERGELLPDAWKAFRLLNGVYSQRQDEAMMVRVKIPQGVLTPPQLRSLAEVRSATRPAGATSPRGRTCSSTSCGSPTPMTR